METVYYTVRPKKLRKPKETGDLLFLVFVVICAALSVLATNVMAGPLHITQTAAKPKADNRVFAAPTIVIERKVIEAKTETKAETSETLTAPAPRYEITEAERTMLAQLVHQEAGNQCFEGKQGVAEVALRRREHPGFANSIEEIIFSPGQFAVAGTIAEATPSEEDFAAVDKAVLGDEPVIDDDVVFFNTSPENNRIYKKIQDHYFCREYPWWIGKW